MAKLLMPLCIDTGHVPCKFFRQVSKVQASNLLEMIELLMVGNR